jgi:hypothetical protein
MQPLHGQTCRAFRRALGAVHLAAFGSLWVQLHGLVGERGVRPAVEFLERAAAHFAERGETAALSMPTLAWLFGAGDVALHAYCALGFCAGLVLLFAPIGGRFAVPALGVAYVAYLTLLPLGAEFLRFQWDLLLLESTFAALFYTPRFAPSVWIPRLVLFKLMLSSGVVKLQSGDPTWSGFTALDYHYWTQPIPHLGAYYAHHAPGHALSTALTLGIELLCPFLLLLRPSWAFWPFAVLLGGIALTGNYGFFGLLTLALCLPLLPDAQLDTWTRRLFRRPPRPELPPAPPEPSAPPDPRPPTPAMRRLLPWAPCAFFVVLNAAQVATLTARRTPDSWAHGVRAALVEPFDGWSIINGYGLFARMTTDRLEITLEGSADGETWRPYTFRYKPDPHAPHLRVAGPHMPRLDWQMWFAALGECRRNPWLVRLQERLLDGEPTVRALFQVDPFPDTPPTRLRTRVSRARFAPWEDGPGWRFEALGDYCPVVERTSVSG